MSARSPRHAAQLIRGADLIAAPWHNGGGVTREIAVFPPGAGMDEFVWRASVADVAQPGPFSRLAGVERTLVLLAGAGMMLDEAGGATHVLARPLDVARFAGDVPIGARLVDGATRDFNLMLRRGGASARVEVWRGSGAHTLHADADVVLLFCAGGSPGITLGGDAPIALASGDTLRVDAPGALHCAVGDDGGDAGNGATGLLAISIHYS